MSYICVATIFIFLPWPKSQISMCASGTFGEKRNDLLDEKLTISELCEHIHISGSSITIGIILKLDVKKLDKYSQIISTRGLNSQNMKNV